MENFLKGFLEVLEYADTHDGIIAMIGIAVTVFIFHREVTNNFYTLEKENFNDVFRTVYKDIPIKIKQLENSSQVKWDFRFGELMNALMAMLDEANYFRYTMPYLYELLEIYIREIEDLSRHDNWRIYRCSEKQIKLVSNKACKIIKVINNASKGRVTSIKIHRSWVARKIKSIFNSYFIDRPYDRIVSYIVKSSCYEAVDFNSAKGETYSQEELRALKWGHLHVIPKSGITRIRIIPIYTTEVIRFGFLADFRMGKKIGIINLKSARDKHVKIFSKQQIVKVDWNDNRVHKVVVMWSKLGDDNHLFYDVVKFNKV